MPRDYLLRFIEEASRMLAIIHAERRVGGDQSAIREIEVACVKRIGLPFGIIKRSSPEDLLDLIHRCGDPYGRSILLSELLLEDAAIMKTAEKPIEAVRSQILAFSLLADAIDVLSPTEEGFYRAKLNALADELSSIGGGPYLEKKLSAYAQSKVKGET